MICIKPHFNYILKKYKKRCNFYSFLIKKIGFNNPIEEIRKMLLTSLYLSYIETNKIKGGEEGFIKKIFYVAYKRTIKRLYLENGWKWDNVEQKWKQLTIINNYPKKNYTHLDYENLLKSYPLNKEEKDIFILYLQGNQLEDIIFLTGLDKMKIQHIINKSREIIKKYETT